MNYMHLKYLIVFSNNVYPAYKFLCVFIQLNTTSAFFRKLWKNHGNSKLYLQKVYHLAKSVCCMQNFV